MKTPEQVAADIVNQFAWYSNVVEGGCLVGQQHAVAQKIAEAIRAERDTAKRTRSAIYELMIALNGLACGRLKPRGKKVEQARAIGHAVLGLTHG